MAPGAFVSLHGAPATPTPSAVVDGTILFRRNWLRIIATSLPAMALLIAAGLVLRQYSATAVIMVDPRATRITQSSGVLGSFGQDVNAIESIVQVAKSDHFLGAVVDKLELTHEPYFAGRGATEELQRQAAVEKLASKLVVSRRGTSYVIDATVTSPAPALSAQIANAAAQIIIDEQARLRFAVDEKAAQEIANRLLLLRERVSRAEEAAADLKAKLKVTDAGQGNTLLERRVFELTQQLALANAKAADARARYEFLRKAGSSTSENAPQAGQSSVLIALRADYARLTRQAADQGTVLGPRHPEVAGLHAQINDVRRQINAEIARMAETARSEYLQAEQGEATLAEEVKSLQAESGTLGPEVVKLHELEHEAKAERAVYEELLARQRQLTQVKGLEPADIRVASTALAPSRSNPPFSVLVMGAACVAALMSTGYAFIREQRRRTLKTAAQAERLGGVRALGFLPTRPETGGAAIPDLTPWLGQLRAALSPAAGRDAKVILISSSRRGEGRSTVAVNLAACFAEGGDRVLLIEADGARQSRQPFGLLDVLETGEGLKRALIRRSRGGYALLPYGGGALPRYGSVGALMGGVNLRATLKVLRRWFDVVIIDGPPALETPYARFLAEFADETAFLVEWDATRASDVDLALDCLGLREAALVFNRTDTERLKLYDPAGGRHIESLALAA